MLTTQKPFDWRAFWADLLQGTGRALLTLDDSDAARAAIAGLEHFEAAQRRWDARQSTPDDEPNDPLASSDADGPYVRLDLPLVDFDGGGDALAPTQGYSASTTTQPRPGYSFAESMRVPSRSGAAGQRRKQVPMSANPYDFVELPAEVSFRTGGLPAIRRR